MFLVLHLCGEVNSIEIISSSKDPKVSLSGGTANNKSLNPHFPKDTMENKSSSPFGSEDSLVWSINCVEIKRHPKVTDLATND
jgi:hypothetical protein